MVKLSEKEKAAHKAAFQAMSPAEKAEHIFTYHKWTIRRSSLSFWSFSFSAQFFTGS